MQGLLGKPHVSPSLLFVFDTQPLAKPPASVLLHCSVGLTDRTQAEVVRPTINLPVERFHQRCRILLGSVANVNTGTRSGYEYVAFDYDSQSGDMSHTETIIAIKAELPRSPVTSLSRASRLQLERVGEWIFAFEARRIVSRGNIDNVVDDIINLLDYAKGFPQNV